MIKTYIVSIYFSTFHTEFKIILVQMVKSLKEPIFIMKAMRILAIKLLLPRRANLYKENNYMLDKCESLETTTWDLGSSVSVLVGKWCSLVKRKAGRGVWRNDAAVKSACCFSIGSDQFSVPLGKFTITVTPAPGNLIYPFLTSVGTHI